MSNSNFISPLLEKQLNTDNLDNNFIKPCSHSSITEKRLKIDQNNYINNDSNKPIYSKNKHNSGLRSSFNIENKNPEGKELVPSLEKHYNVLWRKKTNKKNKTWKGDGILSVSGNICYLKDLEGNK